MCEKQLLRILCNIVLHWCKNCQTLTFVLIFRFAETAPYIWYYTDRLERRIMMLLCIMKMPRNRAETICIFEKNCKFYISRRLHSFQRSLDFATCLNIRIKNLKELCWWKITLQTFKSIFQCFSELFILKHCILKQLKWKIFFKNPAKDLQAVYE